MNLDLIGDAFLAHRRATEDFVKPQTRKKKVKGAPW